MEIHKPDAARSVRKFLLKDRGMATRLLKRIGWRSALTPMAVTFACFVSADAWSAEGFFTDPPPPSLARAWAATVGFIGRNPATGVESLASGTIIGIHDNGDGSSRVWVLTDEHVVHEREAIIPSNGFRIIVDGSVMLPSYNENNISTLTNYFNIEYYNYDEDLAIVSFVVDSSKITNLHAAFMGICSKVEPGDRVYALGYPGLTNRPIEDRSFPYEQPNTWMKRWSAGSFTDTRGEDGLWRASADSVSGMSGGPVVTEDGRMIGIMQRSPVKYGGDHAILFSSCYILGRVLSVYFSELQQEYKKTHPRQTN